MRPVSESTIDTLKFYLTLQLEAYQQQDWNAYRQLEEKILDLENRL